METQEEVDELTQTVENVKANVAQSKAASLAEIEALEKKIAEGASPSELDFSKLKTAIEELDTETQPNPGTSPAGGTQSPEDAARGSV